MSELTLRLATPSDEAAIWAIFEPVVRAGETYAYERDTTPAQMRSVWLQSPRQTWVCEQAGEVVGTYYLKTNQQGAGQHVCNCGYMVSSTARGQGVASTMCRHSQTVAREMGYLAMQFNFVVATNSVAIALWEKLGFRVVGRMPKVFDHPHLGMVDALVMHKFLK